MKVANLLEKYCPDGKKIKGLIQINIDNEDSKSGINLDEVNTFLENISSMKKNPYLWLYDNPEARKGY
ncbi:MAG: hypothetical protein ACJ0DL_00025 [Gammaproteobacteria bacterium]